jgi:hypothetical protein
MADEFRALVPSSLDEAEAPRRRFLQAGLAAAAATLVPTPARADPFVPNETQVSAAQDLVDLEYSPSLGMYCRVDYEGRLWVGDVDRATGNLVQADGRQILADAEAMTISDIKLTLSGPEWVTTPDGDQVVYTKFVGRRHNATNARIALAIRASNGQWSGGLQGPNLPRYGVFGSSTDGGVNPAIYYLDDDKQKRWRDLWGTAEEIVPGTGGGLDAIRFVEGQRALCYRLQVGGIPQAFRYDLDTKVLEQLTFDSGKKQIVWMWRAPEFGNEYVLLTLVDTREIRVYRKLPTGPGGALQWTMIHTALGPRRCNIQSLETFTYAGRSYAFMSMKSTYDYPHEIWFSNIDSANPIFRCISKSTAVARDDPEYFITNNGPIIYFNMWDPSLPRPQGGSLGLWRSDPGVS